MKKLMFSIVMVLLSVAIFAQVMPIKANNGGGSKYPGDRYEFIGGKVSDESAFNRSSAIDQVLSDGNRNVSDILDSWPSPAPMQLCWGICDDGENLWISDPMLSGTTIYEVTYAGVLTGNTITISQGQNWVGDMVSDGQFLYACMVGGPNTIVKVNLATGLTVGTLSGAWTVTSQRGLAYDEANDEFYIGGWNSNMIWRVNSTGATISTHSFSGVSGLAWHPDGGPGGNGSLWVMVNASNSLVTELDPNNGWAYIQSFLIPGGEPYGGAGIEIKRTGNDAGALWIANQEENTIYLVDLGEPLLSAVPLSNWAISIGILLILAATLIRFRRL